MSTRASTPTPRRPAAAPREPHRNGGVLGLLALASRTEIRSKLRTVDYAVGAVAVPVLLYAMFGLPNASRELPGGSRVGLVMLVSMASYGVVSLAIFTFGDDLSKERGRGWTRTLRATPMPTWVHLGGKVASAVVLALLIVAATFTLGATAGGVTLSVPGWLGLAALLVSGVVVFSTLGFAIAFVARPRTAAMIANLIFLPLAFISGFFVPLGELPQVMRDIAQYLPTYHFGQIAYRVVMPVEDVEFWTGAASSPLAVHVAWVLGSAAVLGALAIAAARREAVTRRG